MQDIEEALMEESVAITLTYQERPLSLYNIRDAVIYACNGLAAEMYGLESPDQLRGQFLSFLQDEDIRLGERATWDERKEKESTPSGYFSVIRRPDEEEIGVWKQTETVAMVFGKRPVQMTKLWVVREWGTPRDRTLIDTPDDVLIKRIGYTIKQAQSVDVQTELRCTKNIRTLLSEHAHLLSSVDGPQFAWSAKTDHVSKLYTCMNCDWLRFGMLDHAAHKCSQCGRQPGRVHLGRHLRR